MNEAHQKELARSRARELLAQNQAFLRMSPHDQKAMYQRVVGEQLQEIQQENDQNLSEDMILGKLFRRGRRRVPQKAGDLISDGPDSASELLNDERHEKSLGEEVDAFEDLVDSVDFPAFVRDLLKSVFDANITVMKAQTDDYIRLMREATTGLAKFIKDINNEDAIAYAAENNPNDLNILVEEDEEGERISLTNPEGEPLDDDQTQAIISDAKIRMAQEHRHALREIILMGITRLVVDKGEIEAEVNFGFKATRELQKKDKALVKRDELAQTSGGFGGGFIGGLLGGPRGSMSSTAKRTQFSVSSTKSDSGDEATAKLRGYVNIKFKTDYFKLDNFAQMYGPPSQEDVQAANNSQLNLNAPA